MNTLILGDNLEILKGLPAEIADLVYLDPPFFSNRNYEVIWGDAGEIRSFQDRWAGGIDHYIAWLKERVVEMHRILKPTGSIFLHCDWHADAYIRVYIMDKIFGEKNLRNHIIWRRTNAKSNMTQRFAVNTDSLFFYSKSDAFVFNLLRGEYSPEQLSRYKQEDEQGLYRCENLTAPGKSRQFLWRGVHPGTNRSWRFSKEKLESMYKQGFIALQQNGKPRKDGLKMYLADAEGALFSNLWTDIDRVANTSGERIGYPTQKPEALMERILLCATKEGDVVCDPFMGGGTTIAVADKLNRQWLGIDQSPAAVKVTDLRLQKQATLYSSAYSLQLHKYDYDAVRSKEPHEFESWIILQFSGVPQNKKGGDQGIDGQAGDGTPVQVKRSENVGVNVIKNFSVSAKQFDKILFEKNIKAGKPVGTIIAFSFGKGAIEEVARLKNSDNIIIRLVRVDEIVPLTKKPAVVLKMWELEKDAAGNRQIELIAEGKSGSGIEFYSWDFSYDDATQQFKADVIFDKEGHQIQSFKTGEHTIAVKVVDNEGMENIETVKIKLNGAVKIL